MVKKILIYGTSNKAMRELPALLLQYELLGFVDSNAQVEPNILLGLPIYHYTSLDKVKYDVIVICSGFYVEISEILQAQGIQNFVDSDTLNLVQGLTTELLDYQNKLQHKLRAQQLRSIPLVALEKMHIDCCQTITDRIELLKRLPAEGVVAELGVANGDYSAEILNINRPKCLHLIDVWDSQRYNEGLLANIKNKFSKQIELGQVQIHRQYSQLAIVDFPDCYFDWVYIDTTHSYKQTRLELELLANKVKPGGIIAGHDYLMGNWVDGYKYGVIEAVHEFCISHHYRFKYLTMDLTENQSFAIEKIR